MAEHSRSEILEMRMVDLEDVIKRFRIDRADLLRRRRAAAQNAKAMIDDRLEANARIVLTLSMSLETVRAELRREKAVACEGHRQL